MFGWTILVTATEGEHLDRRLVCEGIREVAGERPLRRQLGGGSQLDPLPGLVVPTLLGGHEPAPATVVRADRIEEWTSGVCPQRVVEGEVAFRRIFDVDPRLVLIRRDGWQ